MASAGRARPEQYSEAQFSEAGYRLPPVLAALTIAGVSAALWLGIWKLAAWLL